MLKRTLEAEKLKLKHSPIWLAFIIIPVISAFMGTFNYVMNTDVLTNEWYSLWTQHTLFYCSLCFPALIGVYCSYICRLEHLQNNWKSLLAEPIKVSIIYMAKFLTVMKILVANQILIGGIFFISGKIVGLGGMLPIDILLWLGYGTLAGGVIVALQLGISIVIKSFAIPVVIALIGGIIGILARANGVGLIFPYALFQVGMCANSPETGLECNVEGFLVMCVIFMIGFGMISVRRLKRNMI